MLMRPRTTLGVVAALPPSRHVALHRYASVRTTIRIIRRPVRSPVCPSIYRVVHKEYIRQYGLSYCLMCEPPDFFPAFDPSVRPSFLSSSLFFLRFLNEVRENLFLIILGYSFCYLVPYLRLY